MSSRFQPPHDPHRRGPRSGRGQGGGAPEPEGDAEQDDLDGPFDPSEGLAHDGADDDDAVEFEVDHGPLHLPGELGGPGGLQSIPGPGMNQASGSGVFGHADGRLDVLERRDRFQIFAHLPDTQADGVRVTLEDGALTILARRGQGDRPLGWGVRLVFGDQVDGELRSVLQDELLLVELPKSDVQAPSGDDDAADDSSAN